jgi:hypothetical protein
MMMIRERLTAIEHDVKNRIYLEQKSLVAVRTLKELMDQIDHEVEDVPLEDKDRLSRLLVSLKGGALTEEESRLIERIIIK